MNTSTLRNRLERLEVRKRNRQDTTQVVIKTCWGNETLACSPNCNEHIHIVTKWGSVQLARVGNEEFDE